MIQVNSSRSLPVYAVLLLILLCWPAGAQAIKRVPRISLLGTVNQAAPARVTVDDLEKLKTTSYVTFNPFEERENLYSGVLLEELASRFAVPECSAIKLTANDGYRVEFTKEEWQRWDILLATQVNGSYIDVSSAGPARIVMPYSSLGRDDRDIYTPKWIWMIKSIEFKVR